MFILENVSIIGMSLFESLNLPPTHPAPDRRWNLRNRNKSNQDIFGPESPFADACVVSPLRGLQTPHQQLGIADLPISS